MAISDNLFFAVLTSLAEHNIRLNSFTENWVTDANDRCLDHAIQIHGAMGESLELPLTLFYRYLRHFQIGGGSNEIQRMLIARKILQ